MFRMDYREQGQEAILIIQARDGGGGLGQSGSCVGAEEWSDSGYISKVNRIW